jgi:uncharacterized protein (TIGR00375 family)
MGTPSRSGFSALVTIRYSIFKNWNDTLKMQIADLHIHSKYSRGTSKFLDLGSLSAGAKIKGLHLLGTGDFTHPLWLKELKKDLEEDAEGVFSFNGTKFVLSTEISLAYKQDGKGRRVHNVILAPDFGAVDQINEWLDTKGRRDYDGRPIFGFSSMELMENLIGISKDTEIIPAHAWTPWFSLFGSKSGFDSIKECFQEKSKYIHAIETGLSSDPAMNWRLSQLDGITLVSNSDSHSAAKLGREANAFDLPENFCYNDLVQSIRTRKKFLFTIEVDPSYGKYHADGHRKCNVRLSSREAERLKNICPACKKPLTIGVLHRVEELADRDAGYKPKGAIDFRSLIPLRELIAVFAGQGAATKKVLSIYSRLIEKFGNEFNVLLNTKKKELEKAADARLADLIIASREEKIKIEPGYDGVYGKIILGQEFKNQ